MNNVRVIKEVETQIDILIVCLCFARSSVTLTISIH